MNVDAEVLAVLDRVMPGHSFRLGQRLGRNRKLPSDIVHWLKHREEFGGVGYDEYHRLVRQYVRDPRGLAYTWVSAPHWADPGDLQEENFVVLVRDPALEVTGQGPMACVIYSATRGELVTGFTTESLAAVMTSPRANRTWNITIHP
ncbi:MAG: hypothetical protein AB1645_10210 [Bacillota bacterium]